MTLQASNAQVVTSTNYLVPASGATHVIPLSGVLSATPAVIDWQQFDVDSMPFQPQGAYIDNTAGAGPLTIQIEAQGGSVLWSVVVPTGKTMHTPFPAPNGQVHKITGNGQATIVYADFPVLPFLF